MLRDEGWRKPLGLRGTGKGKSLGQQLESAAGFSESSFKKRRSINDFVC